jgi:hypothetical protein
MELPYDPLTYANLARNVVGALLEKQPIPLGEPDPFEGNGVYAIYYTGRLAYYRSVAGQDCQIPIYVGKAVPTGGRKGQAEEGSDASGRQLHRRLMDHAKSIKQASNLELADFRCRYLVVVPVWITLAERFLITHFRPIWNTVIDGFGNHAPGAGRAGTKKPRWDILHPGRAWADALEAAETVEQVLRRLPAGDA